MCKSVISTFSRHILNWFLKVGGSAAANLHRAKLGTLHVVADILPTPERNNNCHGHLLQNCVL